MIERGAFAVLGSVGPVSDDELEELFDEPDVGELTDEPVFNALREAAKRGLLKPQPDADIAVDDA